MRSILVPSDAPVLSAWGLGHARLERFVERQVLESVGWFETNGRSLLDDLEASARAQLVDDGAAPEEVEIRRSILRLRLEGQESTLDVSDDPSRSLGTAFAAAYRARYGYDPPDRGVEVESVRVVASTRAESPAPPDEVTPRPAEPVSEQSCFLGGRWRPTPLYERERLQRGDRLEGPALVMERFGAVVVEAGWECRVAAGDSLQLRRALPPSANGGGK